MLNRGTFFVFGLIAAFAVPYLFIGNDGNANRFRAAWDAFTATGPPNQGGVSPLPSASPTPVAAKRPPSSMPPFSHSTGFPSGTSNAYRGYSHSSSSSTHPHSPSGGLVSSLPAPMTTPMPTTTGRLPADAKPGEWVTIGPAAGHHLTGGMGQAGLAMPPGVVTQAMPGQAPHVSMQPGIVTPQGATMPNGMAMQPGMAMSSPAAAGLSASAANQAGPLSSSSAQDFSQLLAFGIQSDDIVQQWDRVSTQIMDHGLSGMRVALVSGVQPQDLAGSMTYYFDPRGNLQRISFLGKTGDPTTLVSFLTQQLGLRAEPALGGGMFVRRSDSNPASIQSALRLRRSAVIRRDKPHARYQVQMELNRPDGPLMLSRPFQSLLDEDAHSKTWTPTPYTDSSANSGDHSPNNNGAANGSPTSSPSPSPLGQGPSPPPNAAAAGPRSLLAEPVDRRPVYYQQGAEIPNPNSPPQTKG